MRHGMSKYPEYKIWCGINKRCYNKNCLKYRIYGAKGIIVCERWKHNFPNFYADMGPRPSPNHSIDRIDNNGNYEPSNCRWTDNATQQNNKATNVKITIKGKTKTLKQWSEHAGLTYMAVFLRYKRLGWTIERSLSEPLQIKKKYSFKGKKMYLDEIAKKSKIHKDTFRRRVVVLGLSIEEAIKYKRQY